MKIAVSFASFNELNDVFWKAHEEDPRQDLINFSFDQKYRLVELPRERLLVQLRRKQVASLLLPFFIRRCWRADI